MRKGLGRGIWRVAVAAMVVGSIAVTSIGPAGAATQVQQSATGATSVHLGKEIFGVPVTMRLLAYYAVRRANGSVTGSWQYDYSESGARTSYRGTVTCLTVQAERAWVGGYVTDTDDPSARGAWVWWQIDDGSQLGLADQTTFVGFGTRAQTNAYCHDKPFPRHIFDANSGGVTVTG